MIWRSDAGWSPYLLPPEESFPGYKHIKTEEWAFSLQIGLLQLDGDPQVSDPDMKLCATKIKNDLLPFHLHSMVSQYLSLPARACSS